MKPAYKNLRKVLVGMNRPSEEEALEIQHQHGQDGYSYYWCWHLSPEIAGMNGSYQYCWRDGHFDTPVYKWIWEEHGKIVESLIEPD